MIIPGALMGVTDYVFVAGVAANPDSITAVLYRWVGSTRSASGITVSVAAVGSGEYRFTWTNDSGFARTDELELVALPVVSSVTFPATVWRSHGAVDAVMRGTDSANTTAPDNASAAAAAASAATAATQATNAATSAGSADGKLTTGRLSRIDRFPDINAGASGGVALVGSAMTLDSAVLTALFADVDVAGLVASVVNQFDEATDLPVETVAARAAALTVAAIVANGSIVTLLSDASTAAVQSSASASSAATVNTKIGTPSVSVSADIATRASQTSVDALTRFFKVASGTIGTGNNATLLNLPGLTFGDDELNDLMIVVYDVSENEYHSNWISAWSGAGENVASLVHALPFTPQASTDTYVILSMRGNNTLWANLAAMITGSGVTAKYTATALENAPAGGGGGGGGTDWTDDEREQIRWQLGIDGTATAPTAPVTSPVVITPSEAGKTTCYALCVDRRGDPKAGVAVYCWLAKTRPGGVGIIADDLSEVFTSGENGVVQIPDRMKGFSYAFAIGSTADPVIVRISPTAGDTTAIPDLIS